MTDDEYAAIKSRESLATPGPWKSEYGYNNGGMATGFFFIPAHNGNASVEMLADDAEFCAHARTDIPKLVAEVERLRALFCGASVTSRSIPHETHTCTLRPHSGGPHRDERTGAEWTSP